MPEPTPDLILEVLEGKKTVPLEQLYLWRDEVAARVEEWTRFRSAERVSNDLADAYRARLHEAVLRGQESAELILGKLDSLIRSTELAP